MIPCLRQLIVLLRLVSDSSFRETVYSSTDCTAIQRASCQLQGSHTQMNVQFNSGIGSLPLLAGVSARLL